MAGQIYRALQRNPDPLGGLSSLAQMYIEHLNQEKQKKAVFDRLSQTTVSPVMGNPATIPVASPGAQGPTNLPAQTMQHPVDAQGLVSMLPQGNQTTEMPRFQGTETTTRMRSPSELSTQERFGLGSDLGMNAGQILDFLARPAPQTHFAPAGSQPGTIDPATGKFIPSGPQIPREVQPRQPQRPASATRLATGKPIQTIGGIRYQEEIDSDPVTHQPLPGAKPTLVPWHEQPKGKDALDEEYKRKRLSKMDEEKNKPEKVKRRVTFGKPGSNPVTVDYEGTTNDVQEQMASRMAAIDKNALELTSVDKKSFIPQWRDFTSGKIKVKELDPSLQILGAEYTELGSQIESMQQRQASKPSGKTGASTKTTKMKLSDVKAKWGAEAIQGYSDDELKDYLKKQGMEVE